jgi:hypothetical protein
MPENLETITFEITKPKAKPFLLSTWYRPPNMPVNIFIDYELIIQKMDHEIYHARSTGSRDQPRSGSFLHKREETGKRLGINLLILANKLSFIRKTKSVTYLFYFIIISMKYDVLQLF